MKDTSIKKLLWDLFWADEMRLYADKVASGQFGTFTPTGHVCKETRIIEERGESFWEGFLEGADF